MTRRRFLNLSYRTTLAALLLSLDAACRKPPSRQALVIQGAAAPPSLALLRVAQQGAPTSLAQSMRFSVWNTVDEVRASLTGGQAHFCGVPTNVAAVLYNRGLAVRLLDVYIWNILYLVSADPTLSSLADLRGQQLVVPFRGDLPDLLTQYLLQQEGLDLAQDLQPTYVTAAPEAAQLLAAGRARHAVLSEPSASLAILKAKESGRELYRVLDYGQAWARVTGRAPRLPLAAVVAAPTVAADTALLSWFQEAHRRACAWVSANPDEAVQLGSEVIRTIPPPAMRASLPYIAFEFVDAAQSRPEVEFFLSEMATLSPAWIGGQLPPDDFYFIP
jgi:NitT/TauT family transport system substrate-binding protein